MFLIIAVLFALMIAFFATQNTLGVTISLAQFQFTSVPLYVVMIGAMLLGMVLTWLISLIDGASSAFALRGKDRRINESQKMIDQLDKRVHELEVENAELRGEKVSDKIVTHESEYIPDPSTVSTHKTTSLSSFRSLFR